MNGWRARSMDMSMTAPMRKPSRIPFFTQALTRQPVGEAASGSAARDFAAIQRVLEFAEEPEMRLRCIEPEARQTTVQFAAGSMNSLMRRRGPSRAIAPSNSSRSSDSSTA